MNNFKIYRKNLNNNNYTFKKNIGDYVFYGIVPLSMGMYIYNQSNNFSLSAISVLFMLSYNSSHEFKRKILKRK